MVASSKLRRAVLAALAVLAIALVAISVVRGTHRSVAQGVRSVVRSASGELPDVPVIEEHREPEVMRLFRGRPLGSYPAPGWRFMELAIQPRSIVVRVDGPAGRTAQMTLRHPDDVVRPASHSASFAVVRAPCDADGALDALVAELRRNDDGRFWRTRAVVMVGGNESGHVLLDSALWLWDGLLIVALLLAVLAMVLGRAMRDEPRAIRLTLAGIVAAGVLLRLAISVPTTMDVWPYSRLLALPRLLFTSPAVAAISKRFALRLHLNELVLAYTLGTAFLAPAALFTHAKALLRDTRAALWAAAVIAVLPAHIRFSHSDTGFIPSAIYASMTFALISQGLRDPSRAWRLAALLATPWLMLITMEQRALNTLFPLLYFAQIWLLQRPEVSRGRRVILSAVVSLTGGLFVLGGFAEKNHGLIAEGLGARTLFNAVHGLVSPRFNTLIHFGITPPLALALALFGLVALWRAGSRRLAAVLVAWMAMFYVANSVVVPGTVEMQSRYHLHLAAPFALLAGWGAMSLVEALAARGHPWRLDARWVAAGIGAYLAAVPWLHRTYERRTDFNDQREYAFVRSVRSLVPRGCTVLEHGPAGVTHDLRFARMGRTLDHGQLRSDFHSLLVTAARPLGVGDHPDPLVAAARAVFEDPPDCLMFYRGLPCVGIKEPGEPIARACAAVMAAAPMDLVARTRFDNRPYDENVSRDVMHQRVNLEVALYRVRVDEVRAQRHRH